MIRLQTSMLVYHYASSNSFNSAIKPVKQLQFALTPNKKGFQKHLRMEEKVYNNVDCSLLSNTLIHVDMLQIASLPVSSEGHA